MYVFKNLVGRAIYSQWNFADIHQATVLQRQAHSDIAYI